jgi:hypothetical protein
VGLPYEDATLTTPDNVKIKAYVIPARRRFLATADLQTMSSEERKERTKAEVEKWTEEMGNEDAVAVGACMRLRETPAQPAVCQVEADRDHLSRQCG